MKKLILFVIAVIALMLTACNKNETEIITHFDVDFSTSYATPLPDEVKQEGELEAAREHYLNKNVKYLVSCHFNIGSREYYELSDDEKRAEYKRISDCGYELYLAKPWCYQGVGEKVNYDEVMLLLTESELQSFKINPEYGYFFGFIRNGDHSPLNFKDCEKYN